MTTDRLEPATSSLDSSAGAHQQSVSSELPHDSKGPRRSRRWGPLLLAGVGYLGLSVVIWWNVWTGHPTSESVCQCSDPSLFTWFIEWPAHAIQHGLNPFYSTAMHYPYGVNLLANTSVLAFGVPLAPITWLFGPVATLNVAITLTPVLSALAMFILLRRWVSWQPAAFIGGLLYGFSPFVLVELTNAHLMLGLGVVPPLIVACLDELLIRQQRRPIIVGIVLGLLVTLQFFIGTEPLLITAIMVAVGVATVAVYSRSRDLQAFRHHARFAFSGLIAGGVTSIVFLALPAWFALSGPDHFSGLVWPNGTPSHSAIDSFKYFFVPGPLTFGYSAAAAYQGRILSYSYFGIALIAVLFTGLIVWRSDLRLWLFGWIGFVSISLSLVTGVFAGIPVLENIVAARFLLVTYLAVAVLLGLVIDHCYRAVSRWREIRQDRATEKRRGEQPIKLPRWTAATAAVLVAVIALFQIFGYLAQAVPIAVQPVILPNWFRTVAPNLPGHPVLLVLPAPFANRDPSMTWQAVGGLHFSMVGEGGPGGILKRTGKEKQAAKLLSLVSSQSGSDTAITTGGVDEVRRALKKWGVTMVVLPDQSSLPGYERVPSPALSAGLITAATGERPLYQAGAWVWMNVQSGPQLEFQSDAPFSGCMNGSNVRDPSNINEVVDCVLGLAPREQ